MLYWVGVGVEVLTIATRNDTSSTVLGICLHYFSSGDSVALFHRMKFFIRLLILLSSLPPSPSYNRRLLITSSGMENAK